MRIVFVSPSGGVGGAERILLDSIRAVRQFLPDSEVATVLLADGPLKERVVEAGSAVELLPMPTAMAQTGDTQLRNGGRFTRLLKLGGTAITSTWPGLRFVMKLRSVLRKLKPDLIHSNGLKSHVLVRLCKPRGVPITWHLHDMYSERPVMTRLLKRVRSGVKQGIAISDAVRRDLESVVPGIPVTVVRNAVDTDHYKPGIADGNRLDEWAGLSTGFNGLRIGLVATYANWKGHFVFLDALAKLPADSPPFRGYIIGGPIYTTPGSQVQRSDLEERVAQNGLNGRIGFVPFQRDPADICRMLDVVVHASIRPEPFGLTIAEAMSSGRAVVVSAAGGALELFTDGVDALGHPPGDAVKLADCIYKLLSNPALRLRLGEAARTTAVERFHQNRFGRELTNAFRNTLPMK